MGKLARIVAFVSVAIGIPTVATAQVPFPPACGGAVNQSLTASPLPTDTKLPQVLVIVTDTDFLAPAPTGRRAEFALLPSVQRAVGGGPQPKTASECYDRPDLVLRRAPAATQSNLLIEIGHIRTSGQPAPPACTFNTSASCITVPWPANTAELFIRTSAASELGQLVSAQTDTTPTWRFTIAARSADALPSPTVSRAIEIDLVYDEVHNQPDAPRLPIHNTIPNTNRYRYTIAVDSVGVASWRYLNKRNPPYVETSAAENNEIAFFNRNADRTMVVTIPLSNKARGFMQPRRVSGDPHGVRMETCSRDTCDLVVTLRPGETIAVPATRFAPDNPLSAPPVAFKVSFFGEETTPANATGYLATVRRPYLTEPDLKTTYNLVGTAATQRDLQGPNPLADDADYGGEHSTHWPASVRLSITQLLGNRADATVELQMKTGDFGGVREAGKDGEDVRLTKYQFNAVGIAGVRLSFGRFLMAAPSNALAIRENGEGFSIGWRHFSIAQLFRRESEAGVPDVANLDSKVWIVQASNLVSKRLSHLRSVDLIATYGRDEKRDTGYRYGTGGVQVSFNVPSTPLGGTAAIYYSRRRPTPGSEATRGEAWSWITSANYRRLLGSPDGSAGSALSLGVVYAEAPGDDPETAIDESYIGETAAFAPDRVFLADIAKRIPAVGTGLRNKSYLGVTVSHEGWSPLDLVARLVGANDDVISQASLLTYHRYRLDRALNETRQLGSEIGLEFQIETPKGVRSSIKVAKFAAGRAIETLFDRAEPWTASAQVAITLK
jgi:hypothetical protein